MGGVASVVQDVFEPVGDIVGDAVNFVGDEIIDPVMEEVAEPVMNTVSKVVDQAMEDPVGTAAMVGTAIFAPQLLPVVTGANALAKGADLDDALTAAALSYAGQTAGQFVGAETTAALQDSIGSASASTAGKIAGSAASTAVRGGDIEQALTGGILNAATGIGVNEAMKAAGADELAPWQQRAFGTVVASSLMDKSPAAALADQLITGAINTATGAGTQDASTFNLGDTTYKANPLQTTLPYVPRPNAPVPPPRPAPFVGTQKTTTPSTGIASLDVNPFGTFAGFDQNTQT